jgi:hypothetical protein
VATRERLDVPDEQLFSMPTRALWKIALVQTEQWHPDLRELFGRADPGNFAAVAMRAGERVDGWEAGPCRTPRRRGAHDAAHRRHRREHSSAGRCDTRRRTARGGARRETLFAEHRW